MTTENKPIEQEPAYQLGKALYIIEMLMGYDDISKKYCHSKAERARQRRYAKNQAINFLAEHNVIKTEKAPKPEL